MQGSAAPVGGLRSEFVIGKLLLGIGHSFTRTSTMATLCDAAWPVSPAGSRVEAESRAEAVHIPCHRALDVGASDDLPNFNQACNVDYGKGQVD